MRKMPKIESLVTATACVPFSCVYPAEAGLAFRSPHTVKAKNKEQKVSNSSPRASQSAAVLLRMREGRRGGSPCPKDRGVGWGVGGGYRASLPSYHLPSSSSPNPNPNPNPTPISLSVHLPVALPVPVSRSLARERNRENARRDRFQGESPFRERFKPDKVD
jgi:hypothetical protein